MSIMDWKKAAIIGGTLYSSEIAEEYEIFEDSVHNFFVRRLVSECDDIGPLSAFDKAENVVLTIGSLMVQYEESLWKVVAARTMQAAGLIASEVAQQPATASQIGLVRVDGSDITRRMCFEEPTL